MGSNIIYQSISLQGIVKPNIGTLIMF